jgi:protein-disulfide isomerase
METLGGARVKTTLEYLSYTAIIIAAGVVVWRFGVAPTAAPAAPPAAEDVELHLDSDSVRHVLGDGPVAVVEFTDFECPYCKRHATEVFPQLKKELIDTGKIRYVSMHFPLDMHQNAVRMAREAECATEFWAARDDLFAGRPLDPDKECMSAEETLALIRSEQEEGFRLGEKSMGTPSFFVGLVRGDGGVDLKRRINGSRLLDTFREEVARLEGVGLE